MLPFLKKKTAATPEPDKPVQRTAPKPPSPPDIFQQVPERRKPGTSPGVQMLKDVWQIGPPKKKKEMPPPGVSSDIYNVPKQRQMPARNTGGT